MTTAPTSSSLQLSHVSDCDCIFCQKNPVQPNEQYENWYKPVDEMPQREDNKNDYFSSHESAPAPDTEKMTEDQRIAQAPYLPKIQVWSRDDGPYTLRVGHQWFHCDDLIINGTEYNQRSKKSNQHSSRHHQPPNTSAPSNQSVYPPPRTKRPLAARAQSYNRTRPDKKEAVTSTVRAISPSRTTDNPYTSSSSNDKLANPNQYQPQSLPTPKEQAERRRAERRRQKDGDDRKQARRERRDSGTEMVDQSSSSPPSSGQLVKYSNPPPVEAARNDAVVERQRPVAARPMRPSPLRRGSSRNNSYQIPVRSRGKKNVRFALPG